MKSVKDTLAPALRFLIVSSEAVKGMEGAVPHREMSTPRNTVSCLSVGGQTVLKLSLHRVEGAWEAPSLKGGRGAQRVGRSPCLR